MTTAITNRIKFPLPRNASRTPSPSRAARSSSIAASISAISARTPWWSGERRRRYARFWMASSSRPLDASHRGDSRTVSSPNAMIPAGTSWKPYGMRHTAKPDLMCRLIPTARPQVSASRLRRTERRRTVDEVGEHDADGDHDLEEAGDAAADILGRALGHESRRDGGDGTDTQAGDDTPGIDVAKPSRTARDGLEDLKKVSVPVKHRRGVDDGGNRPSVARAQTRDDNDDVPRQQRRQLSR